MATNRALQTWLIISLLTANEVVTAARRTSQVVVHSEKGRKSDKSHKTPDLDWEGCKAWTKSGCKDKPGCHHHYVWLDTWRQSCRYEDAFKLKREEIAKFFPVELARLEEKTTKFAKNGCITGGWWYKCYRRMQQILRLFNYVRKARSIVVAEGASHPDYKLVASQEVQQRFVRIAEDLATGFGKNKMTKDFCMADGIKKMVQIPDEIQKLQEEGAAAGAPLTDEEVASIEQAKQSAAMLMMTCSEVSEGQEEHIRATIEASGNAIPKPASAEKDVIDDMVDDEEDLISMLDEDDRKKVNVELNEVDIDDDDDVDDHEMEPPGGSATAQNSSLVQLSTRTSDGPLKVLVKGGWKGMKWLANNGVGWLLRRLAWTLAFLVGFSFSLVRAVAVWPALFISCVALRSVHWVAVDVLWEGTNIKQGFKNIGHCAPEMWDLVGFDSNNPAGAVSQIVVQPAKMASWFSGVHHAYKSGRPNPCLRVTCDPSAHCRMVNDDEGKCYCNTGMYPVAGTHTCALMATSHGCSCAQQWKTWGVMHYYGCSRNNECKIEMNAPSYQTCQESLNAVSGSLVGRFAKWAVTQVIGGKKEYDTCSYQTSPSQVPAITVDSSLDNFGLKKNGAA